VGNAGTRLCEALDLSLTDVDAVCEPDIVAQPLQCFCVLQGTLAHGLQAEFLFVLGLSEVRV